MASSSFAALPHEDATSDTDIEKSNISTPQRPNATNDGLVHRTLSNLTRVSTATRDPGPPPDGGVQAYSQMLMGHLVVFCSWGLVSSFGTFQTYYASTLPESQSAISWIGSFQIFLLFFIGAFSGRALDAGFFRPVFYAGVLVQLVGIFTTSLATRYWQIFLAQGVCIGLGNGLQFCPVLGLVSTYFGRKKTIALAACAAGGGTGGLVFPVVVQQLLPMLGFAWTVRVVGFIMLGIHVATTLVLKPRLPPRRSGPLFDWAALREPTFVLFVPGMFLNFWALYFVFFYIGEYARNIVGVSTQESVHLLLIVNGVSVLGRLVPAFLADWKFGALNTITPWAFGCSLVLWCWTVVQSRAGLYLFAVVYGATNAGIQGLWPATLASLTEDPKYVGVRMGMGFTIVSFAGLTGAPLGGALVQAEGGRYLYATMWCGASLLLGTALLVAARVAKTGWTLRVRI